VARWPQAAWFKSTTATSTSIVAGGYGVYAAATTH
jgi:hypothetical protein